MVSQEVADTILIMVIFILGAFMQVLSMYIIDRFRQKGPAHYLGIGMMQAWAWDAGDALRGGHVAGLPVNTKQLAALASKRQTAMTQESYVQAIEADKEEKLRELERQKEELEKAAKKHVATQDS